MSAINKLIKIIESINLNITDENISDFYNELSRLKLKFKTDQIITYFLKMLGALAKYLDSKRNNIQPDTIPVLNSITSGLAQVLDNPDLTEKNHQDSLSENILKFKSLKNKISSNPEISVSEIDELKAVILAIDWEISNTTIKNFENVITALLSKLKYYKIHYAFLKIMHSIARYIGRQKANAHTDSISFLRSVFADFEKIVQTRDITYKEKKVMLETDIKQFQVFKNKIFSNIKKDQIVDDAPDDTLDDESFAPALSQFKKTDVSKTDNDSFTPLSNTEVPQPVAHAAPVTVETSTAANSENIMDDLFSAKESPADELLDAIHLLNVHGEDSDQALDMLDKTEELKSEGIQNFTPGNKTNAPIPEINDRLDAFFNLDPPPSDDNENAVQEPSPVLPDVTNDMIQESEPFAKIEEPAADDSQDNIIPFQNNDNDESFEQIAEQSDDNLKKVMELAKAFSNADWFCDDSSISLINQNISDLKELWQNNPEKLTLLQIITMNIKLLQNQDVPIEQLEENDQTEQNIEEESTEPVKSKTPGIWKSLKNKFKS